MRYETSTQFYKSLQSLPKNIQAKFARILLYFIQDPAHPSLHTKKMKGVKGIWEVRIDRAYRFTYSLEIDEERQTVCRFRSIGPHDILEQNP